MLNCTQTKNFFLKMFNKRSDLRGFLNCGAQYVKEVFSDGLQVVSILCTQHGTI